MYRDHVWISTLRRLLVAQVFVLLCASAAWGQLTFGDQIRGIATSCKAPVQYNDHGSVHGGYDIHNKKTAPRCSGLGPATAESSASVGPPFLTSNTTAAKSVVASAETANRSWDWALLTPPSDWNGSVPVTLKSSYTFSVQGATNTTRPAGFAIQWYIDSAIRREAQKFRNGHATYPVKFDFDVPPSDTGTYEFEVTIAGATEASANRYGGSSASFSTSFMYFVLPKGWTCKWLSDGDACGVSR
jgi:hypothetical protein